MNVFPNGHVCPLAVDRSEFRCSDPAGKPDASCVSCRAVLEGELGDAMREGDASFFEMLFVGHILAQEGFVGVADEDGGIQLERARGGFEEYPGDCVVGPLPLVVGGGHRLFIAIDDDHEIVEVFDSLEEAADGYFDRKEDIDALAKDERIES